MARHGWGIYLPNDGDPHVGDALEIATNGCYTLLDHQAGKDQALKKIREAQPDALIQVRCYTPNWYAQAPADWARFCWRTMHEGAEPIVRYTRHLTWANEQNLAAESGDRIGAAFGHLASWRDYQEIARWNEAFIAAYRALPDTAADVLHYPGLAYGHGEDWGYDAHHEPMPGFPLVDGVPVPAYELLRPGIDRCSVLNHHPYVQRGADVLDEWVGVRRIEKTIALFPGKAIYAAETGNFDVTSPRAPDDLVAIGYYLQGRPEVVGWTPFILDSPDPGHAMNSWARNPRVAEAYRRTTRLEKPSPWVGWTPPTPQEPPVTDIVLSVPTRLAPAFYQDEGEGNYSKRVRSRTIGVVVHSTAGGASTFASEAIGTVNWFQNRDAGVSAHRVVGPTWVASCVPDQMTAYHARENNADHLGVEFAVPDTPAFASSAWPAFYYEAGGELLARWSIAYGFPLRWVTSQKEPGLITHEDSEAGQRDGKRDPTGRFDAARLLQSAQAWRAKLTGGTPVPPTPTDPNALRDQTYALAEQLQALGPKWSAAGYPQTAEYVRTQGEAIKKTLVIGKGER